MKKEEIIRRIIDREFSIEADIVEYDNVVNLDFKEKDTYVEIQFGLSVLKKVKNNYTKDPDCNEVITDYIPVFTIHEVNFISGDLELDMSHFGIHDELIVILCNNFNDRHSVVIK